jgi:hypothetical protein
MSEKLKATIDRIENGKAVIITDDGQTLLWSIENLPSGIVEGSVVYISLVDSLMEKEEREKLAKDLLNEIVG